jgi:hypothetical protein
MSEERDRQFLAVYERSRAQDQLGWYEGRLAEFTRARTQAVTLTGLLLILATTTSALAAAGSGGARTTWAVLATVFPALSTALAAWVSLHDFQQVSKLYRDAIEALMRLRLDPPQAEPGDAADASAIAAYVEGVEGVLRREQAQWGQLPSEARRSPPTDAPPHGAEEPTGTP